MRIRIKQRERYERYETRYWMIRYRHVLMLDDSELTSDDAHVGSTAASAGRPAMDRRELLGGKDCQLCEPEECPAIYVSGDRIIFQGYISDPEEVGRAAPPVGQDLVWLPAEVIVEAHNTTRQRGQIVATSGPEDHTWVQVWGRRIIVQGYAMSPQEIGKAGLPEGERLVWLPPGALAAAYEACEREGLLCPA